MKKAVEVHITGKVNGVYKGGWWCSYVRGQSGSREPGGIAIHQENEDARQGTTLPVKSNLVKAVGDILFGFEERNDMFEYPCPYVCELHINNDGSCRYRTTGADVSAWEDIHHKKDNSVIAFYEYNKQRSVEFWQVENLLLQPFSVETIIRLLDSCGATQFDTEYITKSPSGHASIYTQDAGKGMKIEVSWD